jgi:hypothetical protein
MVMRNVSENPTLLPTPKGAGFRGGTFGDSIRSQCACSQSVASNGGKIASARTAPEISGVED